VPAWIAEATWLVKEQSRIYVFPWALFGILWVLNQIYRCPPLSSVKLCFHTLPNCTRTSRPSVRSCPSGGCNFAKFPGRSSAKILPKSLQNSVELYVSPPLGICPTHPFTFTQVFW
jgi:hypothetical protein